MLFIKNIYTICIFAIFLSVVDISMVHALSPTDIIVVYNQNMPDSKEVAEYYAEKRNIPVSNLVGVDVTKSESIHRVDYNKKLIDPLRNTVKTLQLSGHEPAILLVYGIPLRITDNSKPKLDRRYEEFTYNKVVEYRGLVLKQGRQLASLIERMPIDKVIQGKQNIESLQTKELIKSIKGTILNASEYLSNIAPVAAEIETYSKVVSLLFRMEGMAPLVNDVKNQIASMDSEEKFLFLSKNNLLKFNSILSRQLTEIRFRGFTREKALEVSTIIRMVNGVIGELLFWDSQHNNRKVENTSASVDSELTLLLIDDFQLSNWLINPFLKKYSKVPGIEFIRRKTIMVCRLDAPSTDMAKRMVDDAVEIEESGLGGKVYIDARGMDDTKQNSYSRYDKHLRNLHSIIKSKSSLPVVLDNEPGLFPKKSCADAALYAGWYSLAKYVDAFEWKKGAVAFHIASSEASTLRQEGSQVWCKRMIEEGVAATLGPVSEPYLGSFPLPDVFFPLLMTGKLTLLETYFKSIPFISWRIILIGDPLYTPFKKNPAIDLDDL